MDAVRAIENPRRERHSGTVFYPAFHCSANWKNSSASAVSSAPPTIRWVNRIATVSFGFSLFIMTALRPVPSARYLVAGSILYFSGTFMVTVVYHVPRNNARAVVQPASDVVCHTVPAGPESLPHHRYPRAIQSISFPPATCSLSPSCAAWC